MARYPQAPLTACQACRILFNTFFIYKTHLEIVDFTFFDFFDFSWNLYYISIILPLLLSLLGLNSYCLLPMPKPIRICLCHGPGPCPPTMCWAL